MFKSQPVYDLTVCHLNTYHHPCHVSFGSFTYAASHTFPAEEGFGDYTDVAAVKEGLRMGKKRPTPGIGFWRPYGPLVASVPGSAAGMYGKKDSIAPSAAKLAWFDNAGKADVSDAFFDRQERLAVRAMRRRAAFRAAPDMAAPGADSDDEDDHDEDADDSDGDDGDDDEGSEYSDDEGNDSGGVGEPRRHPEAGIPSAPGGKLVDAVGVGGCGGHDGEGVEVERKKPCEQYVNAIVTTNGVGQSAAGLCDQTSNGEITNLKLIQMAVSQGNLEDYRGQYLHSQLFTTWSESVETGMTSVFLMGAAGIGADNEDTDDEDSDDDHDSENEPVHPVNGLVDEGTYVNDKRRQSNCYEMKCLIMCNVCNYVWSVEPPRIEGVYPISYPNSFLFSFSLLPTCHKQYKAVVRRTRQLGDGPHHLEPGPTGDAKGRAGGSARSS